MSSEPSPPEKKPRGRSKAKLKGSGAIAQGRGAKSAGKRAVIVGRDSSAPIHTGSGDIHQNIFQQAARPGASAAELRKGYLAWLSLRANELPLLAGDSGKPVQLSSVYTALLTEGREIDEAGMHRASPAARAARSFSVYDSRAGWRHPVRRSGEVVRGGSFNNHRDNARCAYRNRNHPDNRNDNIGMPVVLRSSPVR